VEETRAHPRCVEALLAAGPEDTEITELFGALWPNVPNAGLGVGNVTRIEPAPEIVRDLSSKL